MSILVDLQNIATELGGYAGTVSSGIVTYGYKKFKSIETSANLALVLVKDLEEKFKELKKNVDDRLPENRRTASGLHFDDPYRRIDELTDKLNDLEKEFNDYQRDNTKSFNEIQRTLGKIEGHFDHLSEKK